MTLKVGDAVVVTGYRPNLGTVTLERAEYYKRRWPVGSVQEVWDERDLEDEPQWGFDWRPATPEEEAAWRLGAR